MNRKNIIKIILIIAVAGAALSVILAAFFSDSKDNDKAELSSAEQTTAVTQTEEYTEPIQDDYDSDEEEPEAPKELVLKAYSAYKQVYLNLVDKYGPTRYIFSEENVCRCGVSFAKLIDFDHDGLNELFVVCNSEKLSGDNSDYHYEVYGFVDNKAKLLDSSNEFYKYDGGTKAIVLADYDDRAYIVKGSADDFSKNYLYSLKNGKFVQMKSIECFSDSKYRIDGKDVSKDEGEFELEDFQSIRVEYTGFGNGKYNGNNDINVENNKTKSALNIEDPDYSGINKTDYSPGNAEFYGIVRNGITGNGDIDDYCYMKLPASVNFNIGGNVGLKKTNHIQIVLSGTFMQTDFLEGREVLIKGEIKAVKKDNVPDGFALIPTEIIYVS